MTPPGNGCPLTSVVMVDQFTRPVSPWSLTFFQRFRSPSLTQCHDCPSSSDIAPRFLLLLRLLRRPLSGILSHFFLRLLVTFKRLYGRSFISTRRFIPFFSPTRKHYYPFPPTQLSFCHTLTISGAYSSSFLLSSGNSTYFSQYLSPSAPPPGAPLLYWYPLASPAWLVTSLVSSRTYKILPRRYSLSLHFPCARCALFSSLFHHILLFSFPSHSPHLPSPSP